MGKAMAGACMAIALWLPDGFARVCVCVSPWFWEALTALVTTRALRGPSSAQAVGMLSGFKAEALTWLSFLCQHSTVNNRGICAA